MRLSPPDNRDPHGGFSIRWPILVAVLVTMAGCAVALCGCGLHTRPPQIRKFVNVDPHWKTPDEYTSCVRRDAIFEGGQRGRDGVIFSCGFERVYMDKVHRRVIAVEDSW